MRLRAIVRPVVVGVLDTNCWIVHADGDRRALLVDPGADPERILAACDGLTVTAILLTHGHFDHVLAVPAVAHALGVPVLAHPADAPVWPHELDTLRRTGHWDAGTATEALLARDPALLAAPEGPPWNGLSTPVNDGETIHIGPLVATVWHTPGHTPGGVSLVVEDRVLTGDTLFPGGPGLTGPALSDFPTIIDSVRRLLALPAPTRIHPGHGPDATVAEQRPHLREWIDRGW